VMPLASSCCRSFSMTSSSRLFGAPSLVMAPS
jgi:hypothetical protein